MELIDRAKQIDRKIAEGEKLVAELPSLVEGMAISAGIYARAFRVSVIKLKAAGTPATLCNKLAEGECADELVNKLRGEGMYKISIDKLRAINTQQNGCQSIFSKFSHT